LNWIDKIITIIKLPLKFIVGIALFAGSLFILPRTFLERLKLDAFLDEFGTFIGIAFYAAFILILINIVTAIIGAIKRRFSTKRNKEIVKEKKAKIENKIRSMLDPHEKAVLREYIIQEKNTIEIPVDHHVVVGLLNSGVLQIVGKYATGNILIGLLTPVRLSDTAQNLIYSDPTIIDIPDREPTESEKKDILSKRPDFIHQIERHNWLYKR
jgi:Na+-transporting methylmalonyl-CoA/oxaloacetate decarboxylase gamma subunit